MNFSEALREIESPSFSAKLNLASGFRSFWQLARGEESVQALVAFLYKEEAYLSQLVKRILELVAQEVDPQYENPCDTALAIYLWLLDARDASLARSAASVVKTAFGCWWADQAAHFLLHHTQHNNRAASSRVCAVSFSASLTQLPLNNPYTRAASTLYTAVYHPPRTGGALGFLRQPPTLSPKGITTARFVEAH